MNSHLFTPSGVSVLLFLAESHLSIHTWPENGYAAVDIYTCGSATSPRRAIESLSTHLRAGGIHVREFLRGQTGDWSGYRSIERIRSGEASFLPETETPAFACNQAWETLNRGR